MGTSHPEGSAMRCGLLALVLLLATAPVVWAKRLPAPPDGIAHQTALSEVVIVGTVTSFEKELTEVKAQQGADVATAYTVAVVKIETAIRGLKDTTHVKVGFDLKADRARNKNDIDFEVPRLDKLVENERYLLLLRKHPIGNFYVFDFSTPPLLVTVTEKQTAAIAEAKFAAGAIADPMKALKSEKVEDRALAAVMLLLHYRIAADRGTVDLVPIDADENAAILKTIAECDWTVPLTGYINLKRGYAFLELSIKDGWYQPKVNPGDNSDAVYQKAFQDWLAGPGVRFRIHKSVFKPKK